MRLLFAIMLLFLTVQCTTGDAAPKEKAGMSIFAEHCSGCHGKDATGQDPSYPDGEIMDNGVRLAPALNEDGYVWMYPPELVFQKVKIGLLDVKTIMPKYNSKLDDKENNLLIQYLCSLWTKETRTKYIEKYRESEILKEI